MKNAAFYWSVFSANGPRCGVHVLMTRTNRGALPHGIAEDSLLRQGILVQADASGTIKGIRDEKRN